MHLGLSEPLMRNHSWRISKQSTVTMLGLLRFSLKRFRLKPFLLILGPKVILAFCDLEVFIKITPLCWPWREEGPKKAG